MPQRTANSPFRLPGALALGLAAILLAALATGTAAPASAPATSPARPDKRTTTCIDAECHVKERKFAFVHGPTAVGACEVCHVYVDEKKHTFKLKRTNEKLCDFCHIGRAEGQVVHKPVSQGQCLACHDPHGSASREMLRKGDTAKLCADCHDDVTRGRKHAHGPVGTGACNACHNSHTAPYPKLLIGQGKQLCLDCHKEMKDQIAQVRFVHEPVAKACTDCHEVHASNQLAQLTKPPTELCYSCHKETRQQVVDSRYKHTAVTEDKSCMNCHTAHGGDIARLMKSRPLTVCMSCHDKPITDPGGKVLVEAAADLMAANTNKHGPVRDGNCGGCHSVHGGDVDRLLVKPYPETFYEGFAVDKYALCFTCHDQQLVLAKETQAVTAFRNGDRNLHYVHVNKPDQGRSCRACHSTHASTNPMHVRKTVPFGNWQLPVNFTANESGGKCASGCHQELSYDRLKPVVYEAPATMPATAPTRAPTTAPATRPTGPTPQESTP